MLEKSSDSLMCSVIIPMHNDYDYGLKLIHQVLAQDTNNFELIIIDASDPSLDSLPQVLKQKSYKKKIKYQYHKAPNLFPGAAEFRFRLCFIRNYMLFRYQDFSKTKFYLF